MERRICTDTSVIGGCLDATSEEMFDAVHMMRSIRSQLDERMRGMTFDEERAYIQKYLGSAVQRLDAETAVASASPGVAAGHATDAGASEPSHAAGSSRDREERRIVSHTLVTFLGRARMDQNTGYQRAKYRFPGVDTPCETPFFGMALAEHLKPDAAVILGTRGSQWSVLVEHLARGNEAEEVRIELLEAEAGSTITQAMLDRVKPIMSEAVGLPVTPHLIPFGKDADEQYEILGAIAETVPNGDVSFDLTHGFRHLGMVGFLSAFMLERMRNLHVRGLWYGALDMTDATSGITPVLRLDGLTRVRRWVEALDQFDTSGDYGVFAPLLIEDGVAEEKAACLERAAFHERTLNLSDAARQIGTFLATLDHRLPGASGLFQERLEARLSWVRAGGLADHQRQVAIEHLKRGDFLRAAMFGWEALVTLACERRGLPATDYGAGRRPAIKHLADEMKAGMHPHEKRTAFFLLRDVRNALAHGNPAGRRDTKRALRDPGRLHEELKNAFRCLLYTRSARDHDADPVGTEDSQT